jgi:hypothetical protein
MKYEQYSPDWKDIIRPAILKRDNYKCSVCGIGHKIRVYKTTNSKYVECDEFIEKWAVANGKKVFTLYLQVAHLDHNKNNNDPSNLLTLCPIHHAKYDSEHKKLSRITYKEKIAAVKSEKINLKDEKRRQLLNFMKQEIKALTSVSLSNQDLNSLLTMIEKSI